MSNRLYFPIMGGTTVLTRLLGNEFVRLGYEVKLMVGTPAGVTAEQNKENFEVIRCPSPSEIWDLSSWADLLFQVEVSLKFQWPFWIQRKPFVITNQTHCSGFMASVQSFLSHKGHPTSISECVQKQWNPGGTIIGNPYDNHLFKKRMEPKDLDLLFVGRVIEDKGISDLMEALSLLKKQGFTPELWVVGDHQEQGESVIPYYEEMAERLGVRKQVHFVGAQNQAQVAEWMQRSRVLVVPSRWSEPFGIVGLEGLACACQVVASRHGGLVEATGGYGFYFENHDASSLATSLIQAIQAPPLEGRWSDIEQHLSKFEMSKIAETYIELFEAEVNRRKAI